MPQFEDENTDQLLLRAANNEHGARDQLLARHRVRLRRMVSVRLDPRLTARVDPSDVVQDVLAEANRTLSDYIRKRPLPFYPWLRELAWRRLVDLRQHHIETQKRSILREASREPDATRQAATQLAECLASETTIGHRLMREELLKRLRSALVELPNTDSEVLVLRYLEQLPVHEIAGVLSISNGAVSMRLLRAVERISKLLDSDKVN